MKIIKILGIIALAAIVGFSIAACKDPEPEPVEEPVTPSHVHQYGNWTTVRLMTCVKEGLDRRYCTANDGAFEERMIEVSVGYEYHDWDDPTGEGAQARTCTETGYGNQECKLNPLHNLVNAVLPASGHAYQPYTYPATCRNDGVTRESCANYDSTKEKTCIAPVRNERTLTKLRHQPRWEVLTAADCVNEGDQRLVCSRVIDGVAQNCILDDDEYEDYNYDTANKIIPDISGGLGHDVVNSRNVTVRPATCLLEGLIEVQCPRDNYVLNTNPIEALEHIAGSQVTTTPATCIDKGWSEIPCTRVYNSETHYLDDTREQNVLALGHEAGAFRTIIDATCTIQGQRIRICTRPGTGHEGTDIEDTRYTVAALGHTVGRWESFSGEEATCEEAGRQVRFCGRADDLYYPLEATDLLPIGTLPANTQLERDVNAIGHDVLVGSWTTISNPTCETAGNERAPCRRHLDPDYSYISAHDVTRIKSAALGHNFEWEGYIYKSAKRNCQRIECTHTASVGDIGPGGGKIFYVAASPFRHYTSKDDTVGTLVYYLEVAPQSNSFNAFRWSSTSAAPSLDIAGTEREIGKGLRNTLLILASDTSAPAARACQNYKGGGKTDWYLPSSEELQTLYYEKEAVGDLANSYYWSSVQVLVSINVNPQAEYLDCFTFGAISYSPKDTGTYRIRPVRAF
jgi:hypothetical protein